MEAISVAVYGSERYQLKIKSALRDTRQIDLVALLSSYPKFVRYLDQLQPGLVILENSVRRPIRIETIQRLRSAYPRLKIVIMADTLDMDHVRKAVSAGVTGYLLADLSGLENAISLAASGKLALSPEITSALLNK